MNSYRKILPYFLCSSIRQLSSLCLGQVLQRAGFSCLQVKISDLTLKLKFFDVYKFSTVCLWFFQSLNLCFLFIQLFYLFIFLLYYKSVQLIYSVVFLLQSEKSPLYTHMYSFFFKFYSHVGHFRVLNRVPCAVQQVLTSDLFYVYLCVYVSSNLPVYPHSLCLLVSTSLFSTSVTQFLFCKQIHFLRFHI